MVAFSSDDFRPAGLPYTVRRDVAHATSGSDEYDMHHPVIQGGLRSADTSFLKAAGGYRHRRLQQQDG